MLTGPGADETGIGRIGDRGWLQRMNTLTARRGDVRRPQIPVGQRVYAIGDIHGRLDLLLPLLAHIRADTRDRRPAETHIVLLGDLVDRGPYSAETVEYALSSLPRFATFHCLMGNHEEAMLRALDPAADRTDNQWLKFGGYETLASYGLPVAMLGEELPPADVLRNYVPDRHRLFLERLPDYLHFGDYLFVHAGIRPGKPLAEQESADMRWIRHDFLDYRGDLGVFVIHGHTITDTPDVHANRLGIDTGAYRTGTLTAVGLEGEHRWFIKSSVVEGEVQTNLMPVG